MKVEIKKTGELNIIAETELESFALKRWSDTHFENKEGERDGCEVLIQWGLTTQGDAEGICNQMRKLK